MTPSVLFVCVRNGGKSQMAAGLMRKAAGGRVVAHSAGIDPGEKVNALSAQALAEVGVDIASEVPTSIDPGVLAPSMSLSPWAARRRSTFPTASRSGTGTPTSRLSVASRASSGCVSSATTSTIEFLPWPRN